MGACSRAPRLLWKLTRSWARLVEMPVGNPINSRNCCSGGLVGAESIEIVISVVAVSVAGLGSMAEAVPRGPYQISNKSSAERGSTVQLARSGETGNCSARRPASRPRRRQGECSLPRDLLAQPGPTLERGNGARMMLLCLTACPADDRVGASNSIGGAHGIIVGGGQECTG